MRGTKKEAIPYICEADRALPPSQQTIWWIKPKTGHDQNLTVARYVGSYREGRGGYREASVKKLDSADQAELANIIEKVENYGFADVELAARYEQGGPEGWVAIIESPEGIRDVAKDLPADALNELMEVANDSTKLASGAKNA